LKGVTAFFFSDIFDMGSCFTVVEAAGAGAVKALFRVDLRPPDSYLFRKYNQQHR
jgi:hypothetical protein